MTPVEIFVYTVIDFRSNLFYLGVIGNWCYESSGSCGKVKCYFLLYIVNVFNFCLKKLTSYILYFVIKYVYVLACTLYMTASV